MTLGYFNFGLIWCRQHSLTYLQMALHLSSQHIINNLHAAWTMTRARFLSLAQSKLRLYSASHRPGYWRNLPCDWPSTAWAYSEQETENGPRFLWNILPSIYVILQTLRKQSSRELLANWKFYHHDHGSHKPKCHITGMKNIEVISKLSWFYLLFLWVTYTLISKYENDNMSLLLINKPLFL